MIEMETLNINAGPLTGLGSLCFYTGEKFNEICALCKEGKIPEIVWDLTNVRSPHMNMATLTTFLSLSHYLRQITGRAQKAHIRWDPWVLGFWYDISFLEITKKYDLVHWPQDIIGGFSIGKTNPNTKIIFYPYESPPDNLDPDSFQNWMNQKRDEFFVDLKFRCDSIFKTKEELNISKKKLLDDLAMICAELVTNCFAHGRAPAFCGFQRTHRGITVCICDSGRGFLESIHERILTMELNPREVENDVDAVVLGSLINEGEVGLRNVIDEIVEAKGHVLLSSFQGEVRWEHILWQRVNSLTYPYISEGLRISDIKEVIGTPARRSLSIGKYHEGYTRIWRYGMHGSRVTFEIVF